MKSNLLAKSARSSFISNLIVSTVLGLATAAHSATNVVTSLADSGSGSLRQAITDAAPGDTIVFGLNGTISLSSGPLALGKNVSILGPGASALAISGQSINRIFTVGSTATVLISELTLRDGKAPDGPSPGGAGSAGGGILNTGILMLSNCVLTNNRAGRGGDGSYASIDGGAGGPGGAIYTLGNLSASNCVLVGNVSGSGGTGVGSSSQFGGSGGAGGNGGAICGLGPGGPVLLINCSVLSNSCGFGGPGGPGYPMTSVGGHGGWGGSGAGIYALRGLALVGCTIAGNSAGLGGNGGGGFYGGPGAGGAGGSGGGIYASLLLWMTNCSAVYNQAGSGGNLGGNNERSGDGGSGGAVYCRSPITNITVVSCTIVSNNIGLGRPPFYPNASSDGSGAGVCLTNPVVPGGFLDNIIALSVWRTQDVAGAFISLGHNLIGATNGTGGFRSAGDLVGSAAFPLDPLLGPLTNNGGPTMTMALLPGSPAINAGSSVGAPPTDQRGVARPRQAPVDIGAFQCSFDIPEIYVSRFDPSSFQLLGAGKPAQTCRLLASYDLAGWTPITTNQFGADGTVLFQEVWDSVTPHRFYRLVTP